MGLGKKKNGRHQPITPYVGSWADEQQKKRDIKEKNVKKSKSLATKLEDKLAIFQCDVEDVPLQKLIDQAESPFRFDSQKALRNHLTEGALLNVNSLASSYLGIPNGEYMVYHINSDKAVLVPVGDDLDLVESDNPIELLMPTLLQHWDKVERCLYESGTHGSKELIQQQHSKYPRNRQLRGAIEASGMSQEEIADACGVDPSTVSRWTIDHEDGGRKPNIDHAIELSKRTGQDVQSLFGAVVDPGSKVRRKATSGSGKGRNPTYRIGNAG